MEFNELLEKRRSVRAYDATKTVTKEQIEQIINGAIQAPSWKNSQTGRYYVILDKEKAQAFATECLPEFNANNSKGAALIVTTFVMNRSGFEKDGTPSNEAGNGWGFYDLGLQNENLVLKAKEIGLDTLIMGIRSEENVRKYLDIPAQEAVVSVIAVGYGSTEPEKPKRKTPDDIVKYL